MNRVGLWGTAAFLISSKLVASIKLAGGGGDLDGGLVICLIYVCGTLVSF